MGIVRVNVTASETDDGEDQVQGAVGCEMLPDQSQGKGEWNDRRDDDHDGRVQNIKAEDDEQKRCHEQNTEGDGVSDDGYSGEIVNADHDLISGKKDCAEQQGAVERGHFHH